MVDRWLPAYQDALTALVGISTKPTDVAGYEVGPMPDKVWLLHPLSERIDGLGMRDESVADPPERDVRWADYAARRGIPMLQPDSWPALRDALPGVLDDDYVSPPLEGELDEDAMGPALFEILMRHSERGPDTACFAYWYVGHVWDPRLPEAAQPSNFLRGPLGAWHELFARGARALGPQNIWPENFDWVVETHADSWATSVSGPTALVEELLAAPDLEAYRPADLR